MDTELSLIAPAKLNLFLHINGRRSDGYHELQTYFQLLDWGDRMRFTHLDRPGIELGTPLPGVPEDDNLIIRAARSLQGQGSSRQGVRIDIDKRIPMGGGLGGGSSNAATTLLALNQLWQCHLDVIELARIGRSLGADVPVFVHAHSAFAEGVGEKLTSMFFKQFWYLVLEPDCHVSTAEIFSDPRLTRNTQKITIAPASRGRPADSDHDWLSGRFRNDCESLVRTRYPQIDEALIWLGRHSRHGQARLTGTGACCFTWTDTEQEAQQLLDLAGSRFRGFIAKGVHLSPAQQRLNEALRFARN
jgi:4-diphosphocytidyl-2-C-methyl-D-erythritol kinase